MKKCDKETTLVTRVHSFVK